MPYSWKPATQYSWGDPIGLGMRGPTDFNWRLLLELLLPLIAYGVIVLVLSELRDAWAWYVIVGLMGYLVVRLIIELRKADDCP